MISPEWIELRKENYRVVVDQKYCNTPNDMEGLSEELNKLFDEHKEWNDTKAYVDYDEHQYCKLCRQIYESIYDKKRKELLCASCGGGKLEYALQKLKQ